MPFREMTSVLNSHSKRIVFAVLLNSIGNGMTLSLFLVYLHSIRHFSTSFGGLALAIEALFGLIAGGPIGTAIDKFGPKKVMILGSILAASGSFMISQVTTKWEVVIALVLFGTGGQCIWPGQMVILTRLTSEENRKKIFGLQFMVLNVGIGLGGFLSSIIIQDKSLLSFQIMYWIDASSYLVFLAVILGLKTPHADKYVAKENEQQQGSYRELFAIKKILWLTFAGIILLTFGYGGVMSGVPLFVTQYLHLSPKWLGVIFGINTISIIIMQPFVLKALNKVSKYTAMTLIGLFWGMSWLLLGLSAVFATAFAVAIISISQIVFGVGETINAPTGPALMQELAPEHIRGRASSLMGIQWGLASIVGPAIAGFMMDHNLAMPWVLFMIAGCTLATISYFAIGRSKHFA